MFSMKIYKAVLNKVTIDGDNIIIKGLLSQKKHSLKDIENVLLDEHSDVLKLSINASKYSLVFSSRRRDDYFELYNFLIDKFKEFNPERFERIQQLKSENTPYCPKCLSTSLHSEKKSYIIDYNHFNDIHITCLNCKYEYKL